MTTFIHDSLAGGSDSRPVEPVVSVAAVWEPSGFREGSAEQRGVRTLRPLDRTYSRVSGEFDMAEVTHRETWRDRARRRREVGLTYLLGGLLGTAVVAAAVLGVDGEETPATNPGTVQEAVR